MGDYLGKTADTGNKTVVMDDQSKNVSDMSNKTETGDQSDNNCVSSCKNEEIEGTGNEDGMINPNALKRKNGVHMNETADTRKKTEEKDQIKRSVCISNETEGNKDKINRSAYKNKATGKKNGSVEQNAPKRNVSADMDAIRTKLFWLDKVNDDISTNFREKFMKTHEKEFQNYDIEPANDIQQCLDKVEKIIIVCRRSTCRLEHMLDFFLDGVDESSFDRILVIIVHNKDLGETPYVSSKIKVGDLNPYKKLHFIIDVAYRYKCFQKETKTLFDTGMLPKFLGEFYQNEEASH